MMILNGCLGKKVIGKIHDCVCSFGTLNNIYLAFCLYVCRNLHNVLSECFARLLIVPSSNKLNASITAGSSIGDSGEVLILFLILKEL